MKRNFKNRRGSAASVSWRKPKRENPPVAFGEAHQFAQRPPRVSANSSFWHSAVAKMIYIALVVLLSFTFTANSTQARSVDDAAAGDVAEHSGDLESAIRLYTHALNSGDLSRNDQATVLNNLGNAYRRSGQIEKAMANYGAAIRLRSDFAAPRNGRGILLFDQGRFDVALADFTTAIEIAPDRPEGYNNRGTVYQRKLVYEKAISDFTTALQINPVYADAFYNRALAYQSDNRCDLAIGDYTEAIRLRSDYVFAYNNRGNCYVSKGEAEKAIADYSSAIRLKPDDTDAYNGRGNAHVQRGEYDDAIGDYSGAVSIKPDLAQGYSGRGSIYELTGRITLAIADFDIAVSLSPDDGVAVKNRSLAKYFDNDLRGAALDADLAVRLTPTDPAIRNLAGYVHFAMAQFSAAGADFARSLELNKAQSHSVLWLHLARSMAAENDTEELRSNAARVDNSNWPGPLIQIYLGKLDADEVENRAAAGSNALRQICEANFFLGEAAYLHTEFVEWQRLLGQAIERCPSTTAELPAARAELKRLDSGR